MTSPAIVGFWWGTFLVSGLLGHAFAGLMDTATTVDDFISATFVGISADALSLSAAVLALLVIKGIDRRTAPDGLEEYSKRGPRLYLLDKRRSMP